MYNNLQAIVLAAGKSTRFNIDRTKLAEKICGKPMILFATTLLEQLHIQTTVVVGYQKDTIKKIITEKHGESITFAVQEEQKGTGHALACTQNEWEKNHILVLNADAPLIKAETINNLYKKHQETNAAISFVTSHSTDASTYAYGRVIKNEQSISIVEAKDLTDTPDKYPCINAGIYIIKKDFLQNYIKTLNTNNASKEFYITDLVKIASENNLTVTTQNAPFTTIHGVNTFQELHTIEKILITEMIKHWMDKGVRFIHPDTIYLDTTVEIGAGCSIGSNVNLTGDTIIGKNSVIKEFCSLENVCTEDNITINPHSFVKNSYLKAGFYIEPFTYIHSIGYTKTLSNKISEEKKAAPDGFSFMGARVAHSDNPVDEQ